MQPILSEKVEIAVASLKKKKYVVVDNTPAELVQACGTTMRTGSGEQELGLRHGLIR